MNVIVQSKTIPVTAAMRNFIVKQASRLQRRSTHILKVTVFVELVKKKKNDVQAATAKFLIDIPGKNIVVQEKAKNLYRAIHDAGRATSLLLSREKNRNHAHVLAAWKKR